LRVFISKRNFRLELKINDDKTGLSGKTERQIYKERIHKQRNARAHVRRTPGDFLSHQELAGISAVAVYPMFAPELEWSGEENSTIYTKASATKR